MSARTPTLTAYARLPESDRPDILGKPWQSREDAIDAAYRAGNRSAFARAVEEWECFALETFARAAR